MGFGERFGRYELIDLLGHGGMGEVWRARDVELGREVALKRLHPMLGGDAELVRRFRREAELTARLSSPYVVPVHDWGEVEGRLYLVMPLLGGTDLATLLGAGALSPERAVAIVGLAARGLAAAHEHGLVHRDVKPSNIMVSGGEDGADPHVYVIDFGIALLADGTRFTEHGAVVGTLPYLAPERWTGDGDARSDVYALACVLFECLTGTRAFDGTDKDECWNAHRAPERPRPSDHPALPDAVAGLDEVVARGLAVAPADRTASVSELAAAARAALTGRPAAVAAAPTVLPEPVLEPWARPAAGARAIAVGSRLVAVTDGVEVRALDLESGRPCWTLRPDGPVGPPVTGGGDVVCAGSGAAVTAMSAAGAVLWRGPEGHRAAGVPAVDATRAYAVVGDALVALDLATGRVRWTTPVGDPARSGAPATGADLVLLADADGVLRALDPEDGRIVWQARGLPSCGPDAPAPVVVDDVVALVGDRDGAAVLAVVDVRDGSPGWECPAGPAVRELAGRRVVPAGARVLLRTDRDVVALDRRTGAELWRLYARGAADVTGTADGGLVVLDWRGVSAHEPADGALRWRRALSADLPSARIAAGQAAIVVADRRRLVALDPATGQGPPDVA